MIIWFFEIPVVLVLIVALIVAAILDEYGRGIWAALNFIITAVCFICIPLFFFYIYLFVKKIRGKEVESQWDEIIGGIIVTAIFSFIGIGHYASLLLK